MDGVRRVYNIKSMYSSPDSDLTNYSINLYARTSSGDTEPYFLWDPSGVYHTSLCSILNAECKYDPGHAKPEFSFACTITADLSGLRDSLRERVGPSGRAYWELYYDVGILAGAIELTAMILWKDQQVRTLLQL